MSFIEQTTRIACQLLSIDSRSERSSCAIVDACLEELKGFEIERIDYRDEAGVEKSVAVARSAPGPCLAFCGHVDTVPPVRWKNDPFEPRIVDGTLHGLGAVDMKGPIASLLVAAQVCATTFPIMVILTSDEETTKSGAKTLVRQSRILANSAPLGIVIAEPTKLSPVRAHRATVVFEATSRGVQAHAATGLGQHALWPMVRFLAKVDALRSELPGDPAFVPPVVDIAASMPATGNPLNMTAASVSATLAWRYSAKVSPESVVSAFRAAAVAAGIDLTIIFDGCPLDTPVDHILVRTASAITGRDACTQPYGTDASELQKVAPCLIMGPGDVGCAHTPHEQILLSDLADAVPVYVQLAGAIVRDHGRIRP
jgi:acetylornithine deacetylase